MTKVTDFFAVLGASTGRCGNGNDATGASCVLGCGGGGGVLVLAVVLALLRFRTGWRLGLGAGGEKLVPEVERASAGSRAGVAWRGEASDVVVFTWKQDVSMYAAYMHKLP